MASMRLNPPVFNREEKSFDRWKTEVTLWAEVTDVAKAKMGIAVALSLPKK